MELFKPADMFSIKQSVGCLNSPVTMVSVQMNIWSVTRIMTAVTTPMSLSAVNLHFVVLTLQKPFLSKIIFH